MARVLVTGGTGFIGRHLVPRLVERGDRVRCLIRHPDRQTCFAPLAVEPVLGDLAARDPLDQALRGAEVVYHLAGATLPLRSTTYRLVNEEGTRRLAEACLRQPHPPVLVYLSSLAAAGPAGRGRPLTETSPPHPVSEYGRSKLGGERSLREVADRLPVTILRPPIVFGPGDPYAVKLFRLARRGISLVPGNTIARLSWLYVGDLVEAMVLAAGRGQRLAAGAREDQGLYFLALDEQPTVTEVAALAAEVQGCHLARTIHFPPFLCRLGCHLNALRTRLTGRASWFNSDKLREALAGSWICTPEKAKRELGFTCRTDLAEGFRLTCQWYREQGWLAADNVARGPRGS